MANGRVIMKSSTAEEAKDNKMKNLYRLVASQSHPQINEAGIVQNMATDIIIPKATRGPPKAVVSLKPTT